MVCERGETLLAGQATFSFLPFWLWVRFGECSFYFFLFFCRQANWHANSTSRLPSSSRRWQTEPATFSIFVKSEIPLLTCLENCEFYPSLLLLSRQIAFLVCCSFSFIVVSVSISSMFIYFLSAPSGHSTTVMLTIVKVSQNVRNEKPPPFNTFPLSSLSHLIRYDTSWELSFRYTNSGSEAHDTSGTLQLQSKVSVPSRRSPPKQPGTESSLAAIKSLTMVVSNLCRDQYRLLGPDGILSCWRAEAMCSLVFPINWDPCYFGTKSCNTLFVFRPPSRCWPNNWSLRTDTFNTGCSLPFFFPK